MAGDLYSRFAQSFARFAERTFIEDGTRNWSYGEVERLAGRLAARLAALGVSPGDRVLVQTEKSVETLILYIAAIRAGAIHLPLNTGYTEAELAYFASDAEPALAVCEPDSAALFERIAGGSRVEPAPGSWGEERDG